MLNSDTIRNTVITDYLRELNWYYNDNKISNSSKYIALSNDNKTLVIITLLLMKTLENILLDLMDSDCIIIIKTVNKGY